MSVLLNQDDTTVHKEMGGNKVHQYRFFDSSISISVESKFSSITKQTNLWWFCVLGGGVRVGMCFLPPSTDDLAHTKKSFSEDLCVPGRSAFLLQTMILLFFVFYVAVAFSCSSFSSGGGGRGIAEAIFL